MAEDSFQKLLTGFIVATLVGVLLLSAIVVVGNANGKTTSDFDNGALDLTGYETYLENTQSQTDTYRDAFESGNIFITAGVVVSGIFGLATNMVSMIFAPFTFYTTIMTTILGVPEYVSTTLGAILILSIIFGVWSLIKIGN